MKFKKALASLLAAVLAFGTVAVHTVAAADAPGVTDDQDHSTNNGENDEVHAITVDSDFLEKATVTIGNQTVSGGYVTSSAGQEVTVSIRSWNIDSADGLKEVDVRYDDDMNTVKRWDVIDENGYHPFEFSFTFEMPACNVVIEGIYGYHYVDINIAKSQNGTVWVDDNPFDSIYDPEHGWLECRMIFLIEPDEGYELDAFTVTSLYSGKPAKDETPPFDPDNPFYDEQYWKNRRSYWLPHGGVNVSATFKKIGDTETPTPTPPPTPTPNPTPSQPSTSKPTESDPEETKPTEFTPVFDEEELADLDEETKEILSGITVTDENGAFEDGVVMNVKSADKNDGMFSFDITFTKNGVEVQPNGPVTVKVPVPEYLKGEKIYVYHYDEYGRLNLVPSEVKDGYVIFEATHFSVYALSNELIEDEDTSSDTSDPDSSAPATSEPTDNNPNTGIGYAFVPALLAAGALIASTKKRK